MKFGCFSSSPQGGAVDPLGAVSSSMNAAEAQCVFINIIIIIQVVSIRTVTTVNISGFLQIRFSEKKTELPSAALCAALFVFPAEIMLQHMIPVLLITCLKCLE